MLTAEVIPIKEKEIIGIKLQEAGFNIVSIGETITIGGTPEQFEIFFNMKLEKTSRAVIPDLSNSAKMEYYRPLTVPTIPEDFRPLIKEVLFPEPPEYF